MTEQDHDPEQLHDGLRDQLRDGLGDPPPAQFNEQPNTADDDRDMDTSVFEAITLARSAALRAGVGVETTRHTPEDEEEQGPARKVSLAFELENLDGAPSLIPIEKALEEIPGVAATIVYPSATAWISADEDKGPGTADPRI